MREFDRPAQPRDGVDLFASALLAAIVLFAPLIKGGNRPLPLLALELAALLLLAHPLLRPVFLQRVPAAMLAGLVLLMLLPLLQLLPLPFSMWQSLPGREVYAEALVAFSDAGMRPLSLEPHATESAWLALLPPLAVFLVTISLPATTLRRLVYLFLAVATGQAVYALIQFGGGAATAFRTSLTDIGTGVGTYVNRNHLAGLLEMALPVALGLLASRIGRARESARYLGKGLVNRLSAMLSNPGRFNQALIFGAVCIALLLGVVFSRSRTGITLTMVGIFLSAVLYGLRLGGRRSSKLVMLVSVVGLALALEVGLAPVLERFSVGGALEDARWQIYGSSTTGLLQFLPFGSGLGTFPEVYRRFQPDDIACFNCFINHAHNDYIEYLFEGGLAAAIAILLFLVAYVRAWPRLLHQRAWGTLDFMQAGAGLGLLLLALHGLTDYNWHIPANAIYFSLLAGVFLHRGEAVPGLARAVDKKSRSTPPPPSAPAPIVHAPGSNPFAD